APAPRRAAAPAPAAAAVRMPAKGDWFVQLGAYQNAAVAKDGWGRAARRLPVLARLNPNGATATVKGASVYRLSVGGFARTDAVALCRGLRARGGPCFVRGGVGEQIAAWHKASPNRLAKTAPRGKGAQLAAR
ncbi:SPOR domain-containing protein, partial [Sphingomonas ginsenosidimutans]|uniref:SPOR domain-containing protein n=3 Tax=Sphingomonas TaxID=13687 RepID=UPI001D9FA3F4